MKVWNSTVKTVVAPKRWNRKQNIGKTSYGLTALAHPSSGRKVATASTVHSGWCREKTRDEKNHLDPLNCVTLRFWKLTEPKKIFYYLELQALKVQSIKAKFPWWNTELPQSLNLPWSHVLLCENKLNFILWGRTVDCLYISFIFKCKPFSDFRNIIVFTMLPSIVKWVHNKYCIEHINT